MSLPQKKKLSTISTKKGALIPLGRYPIFYNIIRKNISVITVDSTIENRNTTENKKKTTK
jgi:hypothetical protein